MNTAAAPGSHSSQTFKLAFKGSLICLLPQVTLFEMVGQMLWSGFADPLQQWSLNMPVTPNSSQYSKKLQCANHYSPESDLLDMRQSLGSCIFKKLFQVIMMLRKAQGWNTWLFWWLHFSEAQIWSSLAFATSNICHPIHYSWVPGSMLNSFSASRMCQVLC